MPRRKNFSIVWSLEVFKVFVGVYSFGFTRSRVCDCGVVTCVNEKTLVERGTITPNIQPILIW